MLSTRPSRKACVSASSQWMGLALALAQEQTPRGLEGPPPALMRFQPDPDRILDGNIKQGHQRWEMRFQRAIQHQHFTRDLLGSAARVIQIVDAEILAQQLRKREVGRGFAMRDRRTLKEERAVGAMRVRELPKEARL